MKEDFFKTADRDLIIQYLKQRTDLKSGDITAIMGNIYGSAGTH